MGFNTRIWAFAPDASTPLTGREDLVVRSGWPGRAHRLSSCRSRALVAFRAGQRRLEARRKDLG